MLQGWFNASLQIPSTRDASLEPRDQTHFQNQGSDEHILAFKRNFYRSVKYSFAKAIL
jgi:hypothetical protein